MTGSTDRAADDSTNDQAVNVALRVRPNDIGNLAVTDIVVGGLSLATIARVEIGALTLQCNGNVSELSNRLNSMR